MSEYENDLEINKKTLDDDWLRQPRLFMKWSERVAQAMFERDRAKENLEVTKAELDGFVRIDPLAYGWEDNKKPTEAFIANAVLQDERYKEASLDLAEKQKSYSILSSAKEAFNHRKAALEGLTKLFHDEYWTTTTRTGETVKIDETNERQEVQKGLSKNPRLRRLGRREKDE